jgi:hypothetical protein
MRSLLSALARILPLTFVTITGLAPLRAAESNSIVRGPLFSGTIMTAERKQSVAMKGLVITLGAERQAHVCYDADLMRLALAWSGPFLEFSNTQTQIQWPPPPMVKGTPVFGTKAAPGWAKAGDFRDPRTAQQGPLPKDWAHHRGVYVNGDSVVLAYSIGKAEALELPGLESGAGLTAFTRTLNLSGTKQSLALRVCTLPEGASNQGAQKAETAGAASFVVLGVTNRLAVGVLGATTGVGFECIEGELRVTLPAVAKNSRFKIVLAQLPDGAEVSAFAQLLKASAPPADLKPLTRGGPAQWPQPVITKGVLGNEADAYAVDTITEPTPNPWNARTFFGGFDFLPDGRAVICTFHGDVWIVSGLDDKLEKITWRRLASGLFQPLGVKVVKKEIYVLGRDQITRLNDLNGDGEADFYENFNNDTVVTANYHEFCLDLHTDSKGNFLYCKGAPWPPKVESPHQGTLLRVSRDGSKLEVIATGFRAPNGMTVGPHDEILTGDNEGHWMPTSKLNLVKPGGFYGMMPTAHRTPPPENYDQPICWLPKRADNSSGGQVFVTSKKWGPFHGHPLFQSYGKCALFAVMTEEVDGVTQAGMVKFPLKFNSGLMRARFNERDGQLYMSGLKGWQTSATRDGGFYRVRYTGQPVRMPLELHVLPNGISITFTSPLDPASANDAENFSVEQWNYIYNRDKETYGSPEVSTENPQKRGHDKVTITATKLSRDGKTVFLEIPGLKPVMQMKINFSLKSADGVTIDQEIFNTIHRVPAPTATRSW